MLIQHLLFRHQLSLSNDFCSIILLKQIGSTLLNYENQGGQRLILSEEYISLIYSARFTESGRAEADFVGGIQFFYLLSKLTESGRVEAILLEEYRYLIYSTRL